MSVLDLLALGLLGASCRRSLLRCTLETPESISGVSCGFAYGRLTDLSVIEMRVPLGALASGSVVLRSIECFHS